MSLNSEFPNVSPGGSVLVPVYKDSFGNISDQTAIPQGGSIALTIAEIAAAATSAAVTGSPGQIPVIQEDGLLEAVTPNTPDAPVLQDGSGNISNQTVFPNGGTAIQTLAQIAAAANSGAALSGAVAANTSNITALQNYNSFVVNKSPVNLATLTPLPSNVYADGTAGVGATLTATANGVLTIDGVVVTVGMRILVGGEATSANNGIYSCTTAGASGAAYVLTRSTDANTPALLGAACVQASAGTQYTDWNFLVGQAASAITIGTTPITFTAQSSNIAAIAALASAAGTNNVLKEPLTTLVFFEADGTGLLFRYITTLGSEFNLTSPNEFALKNAISEPLCSLSFFTMDQNSVVGNGTYETGLRYDPLLIPSTTPIEELPASLLGLLQYGESTSVGYHDSAPAALTTTQPYANQMFSTGLNQLNPFGNPSWTPLAQTAFSPAVEAVYETGAYAGGASETGLAAMANSLSAIYSTRFSFFLAAVGEPSAGINSISKGTQAYTNFLAALNNAITLARAQGDTLQVPMMPFVIGHNDDTFGTPVGVVAAELIELANNLATDVMAAVNQYGTVQLRPPLLVISPESSWTVAAPNTANNNSTTPLSAIGILQAAAACPLIRVSNPKYQLAPYDDGPHPSGYGYRHMGLDFAKVFYQEFIQNKPWVPLSPLHISVSGKSCIVTFNVPTPPLVIDTTTVTDPNGQRGFEALDSSGALTISTVELIASDKVHLVFNRNVVLDGSFLLRYAYTGVAGNAPGNTTGPRGCLRDSATFSTIYLDSGSVPYKLYNWLVTFSYGVM